MKYAPKKTFSYLFMGLFVGLILVLFSPILGQALAAGPKPASVPRFDRKKTVDLAYKIGIYVPIPGSVYHKCMDPIVAKLAASGSLLAHETVLNMNDYRAFRTCAEGPEKKIRGSYFAAGCSSHIQIHGVSNRNEKVNWGDGQTAGQAESIDRFPIAIGSISPASVDYALELCGNQHREKLQQFCQSYRNPLNPNEVTTPDKLRFETQVAVSFVSTTGHTEHGTIISGSGFCDGAASTPFTLSSFSNYSYIDRLLLGLPLDNFTKTANEAQNFATFKKAIFSNRCAQRSCGKYCVRWE